MFQLLWFSDASIMALNLEFSSASKAAGLSNSKIYEIKKDKSNDQNQHAETEIQLIHSMNLCREKEKNSGILFPLRILQSKLFPAGSI